MPLLVLLKPELEFGERKILEIREGSIPKRPSLLLLADRSLCFKLLKESLDLPLSLLSAPISTIHKTLLYVLRVGTRVWKTA